MEIYVIYLSCTIGMIILDFVFSNLYMEANYLACPLDRGILFFLSIASMKATLPNVLYQLKAKNAFSDFGKLFT